MRHVLSFLDVLDAVCTLLCFKSRCCFPISEMCIVPQGLLQLLVLILSFIIRHLCVYRFSFSLVCVPHFPQTPLCVSFPNQRGICPKCVISSQNSRYKNKHKGMERPERKKQRTRRLTASIASFYRGLALSIHKSDP